ELVAADLGVDVLVLLVEAEQAVDLAGAFDDLGEVGELFVGGGGRLGGGRGVGGGARPQCGGGGQGGSGPTGPVSASGRSAGQRESSSRLTQNSPTNKSVWIRRTGLAVRLECPGGFTDPRPGPPMTTPHPPLWQKAVSFAARCHRGQTRKDGETP